MFHIKSVLNFLKTKKKLLGMIFHKKVNFIYRQQLLGLEDEQCCHPNISNDNTLSWQKRLYKLQKNYYISTLCIFAVITFQMVTLSTFKGKQLSYVNEINETLFIKHPVQFIYVYLWKQNKLKAPTV